MTEQPKEAVSTDSETENIDEEDSQTTAETTDNNEQSEEESEVEEIEEAEEAEVDDGTSDGDTNTEDDTENEAKTTNNLAVNIDFSSINYKDFEKINQEQIDLYYMLNDNKNNAEFLNEDLIALSKKEEEIKALKEKEKEEFDFEMEELVAGSDEVKVDLTGIIDDLETEKGK